MQIHNNYTSSSYRFNIFYLFFVVLWPLIRGSFFSGFDAAERIGWIMMAGAVFFNWSHLFRVPKVMLVWGVWIFYNIIITQFKGYQMETPYIIWVLNVLIKPFVTLLVTYYAFRQNGDKTLKYLFYCWLVFVVLGMVTMEESTKDVLGEEVARQSNVLGNSYVNSSVFLLTFAFCAQYKKIISNKIFLIACAIEVIAILLSGSRKGLSSVFIIFVISYIGRNPNMGMKQLFRVGVIAFAAYWVLQLIIQYSTAGYRFRAGMETSDYADNWFLQLMGDRGFMYYYGWELFLDNPLTGIGLTNFRWSNPIRDLAMHSEYMVQLCECGIIGAYLFLSFYLGMTNRIKNLFSNIENKQVAFSLLATILGVLLMNFFAWSYSIVWFFVFFGFIFAYYDNAKQLKNQTIKYG